MTWRSCNRLVQQGSLYGLLLFLPISKAAIEMLFPVLLLSWLAEQLPTRWRHSLWRRSAARLCLFACLAYLTACALSLSTSTDALLSLQGLWRKTLEYLLLFVVVADIAQHPVVARRCLYVLLASACLVGADAVAQSVMGVDPLRGHPLWKTDGPGVHVRVMLYRMTGPYENPIDLATYLMVMIPVVLGGVFGFRGLWRWIAGAVGILLLGCFVQTDSQGAWGALFVALVMVGVCAWRLRKSVAVVAASATLLAVAWMAASHGFERVRSPDVSAGFQDRLVMWRAGWSMFRAQPWTGQGLNTFMANYLNHWVGGERQPRYAHNCYLQVAAETGLIGLIAFVALLASMASAWWRGLRLADGRSRTWLLWTWVGLAAFLIQSAYDTNFYAMRQAVLFWTLAGLVVGLAVPRPIEERASVVRAG